MCELVNKTNLYIPKCNLEKTLLNSFYCLKKFYSTNYQISLQTSLVPSLASLQFGPRKTTHFYPLNRYLLLMVIESLTPI